MIDLPVNIDGLKIEPATAFYTETFAV